MVPIPMDPSREKEKLEHILSIVCGFEEQANLVESDEMFNLHINA